LDDQAESGELLARRRWPSRVAGAAVVLAVACAAPDTGDPSTGGDASPGQAASVEPAQLVDRKDGAAEPEQRQAAASEAVAREPAEGGEPTRPVPAQPAPAAAPAPFSSDVPVLSERELREVAGLPARAPDAAPGLEAWTTVGDAVWTGDGRMIDGKVGGGAQSFLVSRGVYGDFELTVDLRNLEPGNSGVQIRSHVGQGRLRGYQIEIDPSDRAWSGGLYDEGRRGWLDDLSDNDMARAAFRGGEWNRYRIVCDGPWIRTWVNGTPAADHLDPLDAWGHLALQVHSGNNTHVQWRDLELQDRGVRPWEPIALGLGDEVGVMLPYAARDHWLVIDEEASDGCWRAVVAGRGPLLIALRSPRLPRPLSIPSGEDATLWAERHAVFGRVPLTMEPQLVALSVAGGRAALHVGGEQVAAVAFPAETPASGSVSLAATREGLLVSAARLGEPVLRR
jgi:hypothetical protein